MPKKVKSSVIPLLKTVSKNSQENNALLKLRSYAKSLSLKKEYIPLENFFKNPNAISFKISPNGRYLAYLKPYKKRLNIYTQDRENKKEKRITSQIKRDIAYFNWKENETLLYMNDFEGDENFHIFRVSATGKKEKDLTPLKNTKVQIIDWLNGISENHILISTNQRDKTVFDVYKLNIKTGKIKRIAKNPGHFDTWLTDHKGKLRIASSVKGLHTAVYYRETETKNFKIIKSTNFKNTFTPLLFSFDNKNLYVRSDINRDKQSIVLFNPKTKKTLSTVFSHPEVDVDMMSNLIISKKRKKLLAVCYRTWRLYQHILDSEYEKIYQDLQNKLPDKEINVTSTNKNEDLFVVHSQSDHDPGTYFLYNVKNKKLEKLVKTCPWLKEKSLARMKKISYLARDGLKIHGYLTLPNTNRSKKFSLIVHPHGGPQSRDIWGYNRTVQFLANRGYAVLQMNFRGSIGYGKIFRNSGFKQWGRKMQHDITDGVKYLTKKNILHPKKIGIYGASYGGYTVLAGLAFTPNLYACGVDYVGVSNLFTLLKSIPPYWKSYLKILYEMIGHPKKDRKLLKSISPYFHANKIKSPLFVVQGANDPRVKKAESDQIVQAMQNCGVEVPYLVKRNEGHGFHNEENVLDFYRLMEAFLYKHLN